MKGKKWANREFSKVKVIPGLAERAELSATGAAVGGPEDTLTASVIGIVSAVGRTVDIKPVTEIGEIEAAAAGVHVNITGRLKIGSGVSIATHEADCEVIGDSIIIPYDKAACCEGCNPLWQRRYRQIPSLPNRWPIHPNDFEGWAEIPAGKLFLVR